MDKDERATHFAVFAKSVFPEISERFFTMYARILEHRPVEEIDSIEDEIRDIIAKRAYDLVFYALSRETMDIEGDYRSIDEVLASDIPDMTKLPPLDDK